MRWRSSLGWVVTIALLTSIMCVSPASAQEELLDGVFSPDGNLLAVKTVSAEVLVFDTDSLQLIKTLSAQGRDLYKLAFSPDSRYLAWNESKPGGGVGVWEISTGEQVAYFRLNAFDLGVLVFVPGGELLAAQERQYVGIGTPDPGIVHLWKVGTWEKHGDWRPTGNGTVSTLAFTHDGKQFVASSTRGPVGEWVSEEFVVDVQTLETVDSRKKQDEGIIAFSPDGRFEVIQGNGGLRYVLIRDPQSRSQIAFLSDPVVGYLLFRSISPDGKWLATVNLEDQVIIWNTRTWEMELRLTLPAGREIAHGFVKDTYWYAGVALTGELQIYDLVAQNGLVGLFPSSDTKFTTWGHVRLLGQECDS